MIARIVLSPQAEADIIDIYIGGITEFGIAQANTYETMLPHAIEDELTMHPNMGVARPELGRNVRALYRGAHHINYCVDGDVLKIVRILPGRMNVEKDELYLALRKLAHDDQAQD